MRIVSSELLSLLVYCPGVAYRNRDEVEMTTERKREIRRRRHRRKKARKKRASETAKK